MLHCKRMYIYIYRYAQAYTHIHTYTVYTPIDICIRIDIHIYITYHIFDLFVSTSAEDRHQTDGPRPLPHRRLLGVPRFLFGLRSLEDPIIPR